MGQKPDARITNHGYTTKITRALNRSTEYLGWSLTLHIYVHVYIIYIYIYTHAHLYIYIYICTIDCVCVLVIQSCPTLCNPKDCSLPGFSVLGILQARIMEWVAIPFSRGSSQPRDQSWVSCLLQWQADSLPPEAHYWLYATIKNALWEILQRFWSLSE